MKKNITTTSFHRVANAPCASHTHAWSPTAQHGFSMIEVLMAGLLVAIGVLGLIQAQLSLVSHSQSGLHRTQAMILISDIADRIRNNRDAAASGLYVVSSDTYALDAQPHCNIALIEGCSTQELAAYDVWEWQALIQGVHHVTEGNVALLPGGQGSVTQTVAGHYTVTVSWQEASAGGLSDDDTAIVRRSISQ